MRHCCRDQLEIRSASPEQDTDFSACKLVPSSTLMLTFMLVQKGPQREADGRRRTLNDRKLKHVGRRKSGRKRRIYTQLAGASGILAVSSFLIENEAEHTT